MAVHGPGSRAGPGPQAVLCAYRYRLHHRGEITISGDAEHVTVTDRDGDILLPGSLARPPTSPSPPSLPTPGPPANAPNGSDTPFQAKPSPATN